MCSGSAFEIGSLLVARMYAKRSAMGNISKTYIKDSPCELNNFSILTTRQQNQGRGFDASKMHLSRLTPCILNERSTIGISRGKGGGGGAEKYKASSKILVRTPSPIALSFFLYILSDALTSMIGSCTLYISGCRMKAYKKPYLKYGMVL